MYNVQCTLYSNSSTSTSYRRSGSKRVLRSHLDSGPATWGARGARAPCSNPNSTDEGSHLVFESLKLLKPKAHFTNSEGILIHELT